jgi:RNA polymerase sigma factor (sigma-70 family)
VRSSDRRGERWFTALYAAHYPDIVRYGIRRLADLEAASELAQEVFVVAWRRRERVPDRGLPWLYAVARRLLANEWRARRARPPQVPLDVDLLRGGAEVETAIDVWAALGRLSEPDQEILRLVGWEQLTVSEAAAVLGCSRATAAVRLHRARRRLSAALGHPIQERTGV